MQEQAAAKAAPVASGPANVPVRLLIVWAFLSHPHCALMLVCMHVCMYDDGAFCQIHLFFAAFICMNINEVTGKYVCMQLQAPGAAKADSVCLYALIMR